MPSGAWSTIRRWRAFADTVAALLGVNVWVSVILLPGLFVGAWRTPAMAIVAALPLPVLIVGMWRRSEVVLLLAYPSALLIPVAVVPEIVSAHVYGPVRFTIVAVGLIAYLFGASFFTSFYEPPPPEATRALSSSRYPTPPRWLRRFRLYRMLAVLSALFPLVLLFAVNFDDTNRAFLRQMFPGRVAAMTTFLNLCVVGAWILLYSYMFLGVLKPHRTGDRDLVVDLARIRQEVKRGRPRPVFYLGVAGALGFMLLLMLSRYF